MTHTIKKVVKQTYAVYQLMQGHPALIASDLKQIEAAIMVDTNKEYYMCSMSDWNDLKDYVA